MKRVKCMAVDCIHWSEDGCDCDSIEIDWNMLLDSKPVCMDYEEED